MGVPVLGWQSWCRIFLLRETGRSIENSIVFSSWGKTLERVSWIIRMGGGPSGVLVEYGRGSGHSHSGRIIILRPLGDSPWCLGKLDSKPNSK